MWRSHLRSQGSSTWDGQREMRVLLRVSRSHLGSCLAAFHLLTRTALLGHVLDDHRDIVLSSRTSQIAARLTCEDKLPHLAGGRSSGQTRRRDLACSPFRGTLARASSAGLVGSGKT